MTSSIKYLREMGPTKLAALLMTIRTNPMKTKLRLGQIMVLKALRMLTLLSDIVRFLKRKIEAARYLKNGGIRMEIL
jgi:hypothetical protein